MAKILFIEDALISALQNYFGWTWVDDDCVPYLVDKDGEEIQPYDYDFFPIEDTTIEWEKSGDAFICDGVLLFGDGCMEFHDKENQDAMHWDYFTDNSVLKIETVVHEALEEMEFKAYEAKIREAIGEEYYGCNETEELLTKATGHECHCYDEYIDDGCDESEPDTYVMCASFKFEGLPMVVRIYYGDHTLEIGYTQISEY